MVLAMSCAAACLRSNRPFRTPLMMMLFAIFAVFWIKFSGLWISILLPMRLPVMTLPI